MEHGFYSYDMEKAYTLAKGTDRAEALLEQARFIMEGSRHPWRGRSRVGLMAWASWEVERLLDDLGEDDSLLSFVKRLEARLAHDVGNPREKDWDTLSAGLKRSIHGREHAALAMAGLNVVVSDEEPSDYYAYELDELRAAAAKLSERRSMPEEVQKLLDLLGTEPGFVDESEATEDERRENSRNEKGQVYVPMAQIVWWDTFAALAQQLAEKLPDIKDDAVWAFAGKVWVPQESFLRLSRFDPRRNRITLYLDTIEWRCSREKIPFAAGFAAAYARAFFLALFYHWTRGYGDGSTNDWRDIGRWSKSIKEGLADYFAYTWCRENSRVPEEANDREKALATGFAKVAELLEESWLAGFPTYPPASAQVYHAWELFGRHDAGEETPEDPWLSENGPAYAVLYAWVNAPLVEEDPWRAARDVLLKSWKETRAPWVKHVLEVVEARAAREKEEEDEA